MERFQRKIPNKILLFFNVHHLAIVIIIIISTTATTADMKTIEAEKYGIALHEER